ncbi:hypothetical protein, partial [Mesorhizobium sp.]|uniref:hypothetical protein n=1 Tax=Mesorhizobium sp. TaxID=1871066 RepID=UPI0025D1BAF6
GEGGPNKGAIAIVSMSAINLPPVGRGKQDAAAGDCQSQATARHWATASALAIASHQCFLFDPVGSATTLPGFSRDGYR